MPFTRALLWPGFTFLACDGDPIHVDVFDDGRGFDLGAATRGAGLTNMEDRIDALGGNLLLESAPGAGTALHATVPIPHVASATT
ncbi:MAG: hypothetical protein WB804_12400 [Candidatus Dormiibacterota bacterium]